MRDIGPVEGCYGVISQARGRLAQLWVILSWGGGKGPQQTLHDHPVAELGDVQSSGKVTY